MKGGDSEALHVYADGSLMPGKRAGWAYVICGPDSRVWGEGGELTKSSYRAELLGVLHALSALQPGNRVVVHTDCRAVAERIGELARTGRVGQRWAEPEVWGEIAGMMRGLDVAAEWLPRRSEYFADRVHHHSREAAGRAK